MVIIIRDRNKLYKNKIKINNKCNGIINIWYNQWWALATWLASGLGISYHFFWIFP